jgi:DNA primase
MDVILSHQEQVYHVVAVSGTALTQQHIQTLQRYTSHICLAFDPDEAGYKAARRAAVQIWEHGGIVTALPLPKGHDIADMIQTQAHWWYEYSQKEQDFFDYLLMYMNAEDIATKQQYVTDITALLAYITDPIQKNEYVKRCAQHFGLTEKEIYDKISTRHTSPTQEHVKSQDSSSTQLQQTFLAYLMFNQLPHNIQESDEKILTDPHLKRIFLVLLPASQNTEPRTPHQFSDLHDDYETLQSIFFEGQRLVQEYNLSPNDIMQALQETYDVLLAQYSRQQRQDLMRRLAQARTRNDKEEITSILQEIQNLTS